METRRLDPLITCFVPICKNKVLMFPNKHFFHVPKSTRTEWCAAVNKQNVPKSAIYICEDHLNLEEDLLNYEEWKNKTVAIPRLKPQVPNRLKNIYRVDTSSVSSGPIMTDIRDKAVLCKPTSHSKTVQVNPIMVHRSVGVNLRKQKWNDCKEEEEEDCQEALSSSPLGSTTDFTETDSSITPNTTQKFEGRNFMLGLIKNNPFEYIGLPKQYYWLIENIEKSCKIPSIHIIVTLYKIKNNDTFKRMKDLFELSISTMWCAFFKSLKILSLFFKQFLYWPSKKDIKNNMPPAFRCNKEFSSIQTIIDAFEVEIEKPSKPIDQALTWSQYKQCNTIKYLIGATPDGFITFMSEGYGGRISDMYLVEQSGFLEAVPENGAILADRGFKHLESHLLQKNVKVLRPPSVIKDKKMTKSEVMDSKVIASLRIHIERVIRRVRLFKILKPHAVVNNKLVNVFDQITVVACGLINLQSPIIKK